MRDMHYQDVDAVHVRLPERHQCCITCLTDCRVNFAVYPGADIRSAKAAFTTGSMQSSASSSPHILNITSSNYLKGTEITHRGKNCLLRREDNMGFPSLYTHVRHVGKQ